MKGDENPLAEGEHLQVLPGEELIELNKEGLILSLVGKDVLRRIFITVLDMLDTSIAVYEKNGDYSYGIFSSSRCQLMHMSSSRMHCMVEVSSASIQEGQPSHGPCWREAAKASIEDRRPADASCPNGIRLYSVPIIVNGDAIGSIIFGYGDTSRPNMSAMPAGEAGIAYEELKGPAEPFKIRPPYAIEQAKRRLNTLAMLIGMIIERKLAEEALRKSEENLARAQRIAQMGSWTWDIKSDRIEGSTEYYRMFGFERWGYITYNDFLALLHPKDREPVKKAVQAALSGEAPYSIDYHIINPAGLVRVIHAEGEVIRDRSGQPMQMIGIIQDITERKRIEEELARSRDRLEEMVRQRTSELQRMNAEMESRIQELNKAEERLRLAYAYNRSLIEASLDPLMTISPDGKVTDVNKATESVTGYPREHLIGTDFSDYFTEPEKAKEGYLRVFKEGSVKDYPLEIRHKDGSVTPVLYNASVYRDESGKVIGVFAAARDITERRIMEAELRKARDELELKVEQRTRELQETRDYLESLISYANAPIIVWDADFSIRQFNHAFERLSGYLAEEVIGKNLKMLFPPESVDESLGRIRDTLAGERWESVEIPILRKDESVRIALWNSANIYDENGFLLATIAQGQDITERKRADEALRESREILANELATAKSLQQVSTRLIQENDVNALYDMILDTAKDIVHAEYATIQLYYPERGADGELLLLGYRGFSEQEAKFWEIVDSSSKSVCGMALKTRQRVIVPDVHACSFMAGSKGLEMLVKMGIRAIQTYAPHLTLRHASRDDFHTLARGTRAESWGA